jgi:EF hand
MAAAAACSNATAPKTKYYVERNWHGQPVKRNSEHERMRNAKRAAFIARKQLAATVQSGADDALTGRVNSQLEAFETRQWLAARGTLPKAVGLSERRHAVLKSMFDSLCRLTHGRSIIALSEIRAAIEKLPLHGNGGHAQAAELIDRIVECFIKLDTDGNGTIDFKEFTALMASQAPDRAFLSLQEQLSLKGMSEPIYHFRCVHTITADCYICEYH